MDFDLGLPLDGLMELEGRLPRPLGWLVRPFTLIAGAVYTLWEFRRAVLRIAAPLLLAGLLGKLLMNQLPDDGATTMLLLLGLALWHLYQTETLRARIQRLERDLETVQIELSEASPETES
jgi:hypothetical protein